MKRIFAAEMKMKRSLLCWVCAIVMVVSVAGCGYHALPDEMPLDETVAEPTVPDFRQKPGRLTRYVHSHSVGSTVRYDLNGDGIGEDITVVTHEYEEGKLTIGNSTVEIWSCSPTGYFTIVNVDASDNRLLVGISDYGPSDDPETVLYAYDGMYIREIGYLTDILGKNIWDYDGAVCNGDGTITAKTRWDVLGTWNSIGLYRVREAGIEDITDFYPYIDWDGKQSAWSVTARYDIFMYEDESAEQVITVPAGSTVNMLGLHKDSDGNRFWVAFEVPDMGKKLWLLTERIEWASYLYTGSGFVSSEEAFDGFFYAG